MSPDKVGFIGLGRMGGAMAERLLAAGFPLVVCDVSEDNLRPFVDAGAEAVRTARDVADRAEIVFSCLPTPLHSLEVALGKDGVAGGEAIRIHIEAGTIGHKVAEEIATGLPEHMGFLDAPVSGGPNGARNGTLSTIVAGARDVFALAKPYLSAVALNVFHIGETPGQAQVAKLINNHLSAAGRLAAFEGLVLGMKAGIDPMRLIGMINVSTGRNHTTLEKIPAAVKSGNFAYGARLANSVKEETLLMEEASELGVKLWMAPRMIETLKAAARAGYLEKDSMCLIEFLGEQAGVNARAILEAAGR